MMEDLILGAVKNVSKVAGVVSQAADAVILVEKWWDTHIKNSPVSKNTLIFNYLQDVKNILLETLNKELKNVKTV